MIWMVLPETFSLLTRRAATPMPDSSSIGGTSMEVLFCTTRPMIDSGSMSRMRLRFFFRTTCRLTTICGKTTVEASGMIGSSPGMSHSSISADGRTAAGSARSVLGVLSGLSWALFLPVWLIAPSVGPAARGEEAVGEDLVDQFRRQEVARRVVAQRTQLVDVEADQLLVPAEPANEVQG